MEQEQIKQKEYGAVVAYVNNGVTRNAIVIMSKIHIFNGEQEEVLTLKVPDPAQAARVMTSNQVEKAMETFFDVRPLAKTKPADPAAGTGTGWVETAEATSDTASFQDGALLKDLVQEINSGNPIDAYGHDLKDNEKYKAAAAHCGVEATPYNNEDVRAQIKRQIEHDGVKPDYTGKKNAETAAPINSPKVVAGDSVLEGDEQKDDLQVAQENESMHDSTLAAKTFGQNDIEQDNPAAQAQARGETAPVALNTNPESHPEFGEPTGKTSGDGKDPGDWTQAEGEGLAYPGDKPKGRGKERQVRQ